MRKRILCLLAALMLLVPAIPAAAQEMDTENPEYTFDNIDGGTISTKSEGKVKLLVFFKIDCQNCINTMRGIANSDWIQDEELADVCAIAWNKKGADPNYISIDKDEVKKFREDYCSAANGKIQFGFDTNGRIFDYCNLAGLDSFTPVVAVVDADNKIQEITSGAISADKIKENIDAAKPSDSDPDNPGTPGDPSNPDNPGDPSNPDNPDNSGTPSDPSNPDNPDNPETPGDPSNPDNPDTPDNPDDTQKPEQPVQPEQPVTEESSNDQPACSHRVESVLMSGSTDTTDAVVASKCVKCGAVLGYEKVANSAYHTFLKETADAIANAKEATVVIDAKMWVSFDKSVFEAIKSRPDVAVTVNYSYEGQKYVLQIPAGVNVDSLMDENGFGGFRYIEKVLNTNK